MYHILNYTRIKPRSRPPQKNQHILRTPIFQWRVDQRICIKFCFKLGHSSAETIPMIKKAFGDDSMSEAQIKLWYRCFKDGRESIESDRRSGRPSTSRTPENVESVRAAINKNRRLTVREFEEDLGIPRTIVSQILTDDLGKKRVAAKFVLRLLSREQKGFLAAVAQDLLETANNDPDFLKKVITGDESRSMAMTLKQMPSLPNGSRLSLHVRRRRGKVGATSRSWWLFFSIMKVLFTMSMLLQTRQKLRTTTSKFFAGWGMQ